MLRRNRVQLVDLSNNNPDPIDFRALRHEGVFGVLLKVTEGTTFVDETYPLRARAAREAGLHVGGYHFARPSGDPAQQATHFVHHLGMVERHDLHPALDLEVNDEKLSSASLHTWAKAFERHVHAMSGARCLLYTFTAFLAEQAWAEPLGVGAGLWLADYGADDGRDHGVPAGATHPWSHATAHQYTSKGTKSGVPGHVDLSHGRSRRAVLAHGLRGLL